jgi:TolB-like protein/AraC-like DNA-binding protein
MSSDPENEYFSDGITEEIINALTKVKGLRVIARTSSFSFKGKNDDVRTIGNILGVNSVLEGSVRKVKEQVRITAQLINALDGTHYWSKNFDREMEDIFALQDEISLLIADQIRENFGHFEIQEKLFDSYTNSVTAHEEYHKGRYFQLEWNVDSFKKAIWHYKKAIEIDPNYPLPYYGIVMCYGYLYSWNVISKDEAFLKSNQYLETVKNINPNLPEYHLVVSNSAILFDWNLDLAHSQLQRVLRINPNYTDAVEALAGLYIVAGLFDDAIETIDKALIVNPLSANHLFMKGNILYFAKDYQSANYYFDKALAIQPQMNLAILLKMSCAILLGEESQFKKLVAENKAFAFSDYYRQLYPLIKGEKQSIEFPINTFENEFHPWELYFSIYLGKIDKAIDKLEQELNNKNGLYFCFRHDPFLKPIRDNIRYKSLEIKHLNYSFSKPQKKITIPSESSKLTKNEIDYFLKALQKSMNEDNIFLDAELTLKTLAGKLAIHPNKLSWLLNQRLEKNFNEYINQFRFQHFKEISRKPENSHLTILGLAYESGFNSKTVFNSYFKKVEGITPGAWLKKNRNG